MHGYQNYYPLRIQVAKSDYTTSSALTTKIIKYISMSVSNKNRDIGVDDDTRTIVNKLRFPDETFEEALERYIAARNAGIDYSYLLNEDRESRTSPYGGSGTVSIETVGIIEMTRKEEGKTVEDDILFGR
jgi:hypothetical protein